MQTPTPTSALKLTAQAAPLPVDWLRRYQYALAPAECVDLLSPLGLPRAQLDRVTPEGLEGHEDDMPVLLDLTTLRPDERVALLTLLDTAQAAQEACALPVLIASELDASTLRSRWQRLQRVRCGQERAWLRAFDPRVLLHLARVLGQDAWADITAGWEALAVNMAGAWWQVQWAPCPPRLPAQSEVVSPAAWDGLQRIGPVNRALADLGLHSAQDLLQHAPLLDGYAARAQERYGMDKPQELAAFAVMAARIHPAFDEHPVAQEAFGEVLTRTGAEDAQGSEILECLERLTPAQREQIHHDLNNAASSATNR
jgi:Domain of unknown function (DUF4123)